MGEDLCHDRLAEPLEAGLLVPSYEAYSFLHDRVQEAAYSSIAEERRAALHLEVGRRLQADRTRAAVEEKVFLIVSQLNRAAGLLRGAERENLARLDALAGRKAKASVAYAAARACFAQAVELQPPEAWGARHRETFSLHFDLAECDYLLGDFESAEARAGLLIGRARGRAEKAEVYALRMRSHQVAGRFAQALELAREGLELFGIR